eukprot:gnl/TRDRNA2_/TRDRNA2_63570_c0_seq1.p1 gnl/TRDRNA2_/TRDRNA2_63570_c0~~gnl/TRDRNA2_/TRDRNA2_63570_c0_seq1.p1  ORF type:complete len:245 (-),score=38.37 gnl/TRDRNA2_/TRDRNA2_63570_c0_seq1:107-820(-)
MGSERNSGIEICRTMRIPTVFVLLVELESAAGLQQFREDTQLELQPSTLKSPIHSFCWGNIGVLNHTVVSDDHVKGAVVMARSSAGQWDWAHEMEKFHGAAGYHHAGIQPEDVQSFMQQKKKVIFLTAGVVGVLNIAAATRDALIAGGYDFLDLAEDNHEAKKIGDREFHHHCSAGNLNEANCSPKAREGLRQINEKVKSNKMIAIRAYTGDALILFNELHRLHPSLEFVGLLHSNC